MSLIEETKRLLNGYYEDEDYYDEPENYTPSKAELERRALAKAQRLFPYECKASNEEEPDTVNWTLEDYASKGIELRDKYKNICMNQYSMTIQEMQNASSDNIDGEVMWYIRQWRRWGNFVNTIKV